MGYARYTLLSLLTTASASITLRGQTVQVDADTYYVPPVAVTTLELPNNLYGAQSRLVPLTVFQNDALELTTDILTELVDGYLATDDVFSTGFLESMQNSAHLIVPTDKSIRSLHFLQWLGQTSQTNIHSA